MEHENRKQLPRWIDDADQEHSEAAVCRGLTPDQRGERLVQCCRLAMVILRGREDAALVLAHRDPLPESSVQLLASLRTKYGVR